MVVGKKGLGYQLASLEVGEETLLASLHHGLGPHLPHLFHLSVGRIGQEFPVHELAEKKHSMIVFFFINSIALDKAKWGIS